MLEGRWVSLSAPRICDLSPSEVRHRACRGAGEGRTDTRASQHSRASHHRTARRHHQGCKATRSRAPRGIGGRKALLQLPEVSSTSTKSHITSAQPHWIAVGRTRRSWPQGSSPSWKQLGPAGPGTDQAPVRDQVPGQGFGGGQREDDSVTRIGILAFAKW